MKTLTFLMAVVLLGTTTAHAATNPTSVVAKVFEVRASVNSDCSSSVTIFKANNPAPVDFIANPTLGSGAIPNGTYHCIAIHLSDVITITPQGNDGTNCHAGVPFTQDIFVNPGQGDISYTPGGEIINGTGQPDAPSEDDPWVYFTDASDAKPTNSCFLPPFADCQCVNAGPCRVTPLTIRGDQTHTLVVNFDNAVGDFGNGRCELRLPTMALR